ncbi:MAG TPA: SDR family oxidoreductase [Propionibacteriaceae bacterium]|nr:SDR family oxidoreductase [Propionibacteriaceae bacterium]
MHVFLTGATGTIGSAVLPELLGAGHTVTALARSEASASAAAAAGAQVVRGGLADLDVLRAAADAADGVIHLAYNHDFSAFEAAAAEEGRVLTAIGEVLSGTDRPLVVASGTPTTPGRASTEDDPTPTQGPLAARGRNAQAVLDLAHRGVRSAVVRLPRTVHNRGNGGFAGMLVATARREGVAGYPGDGAQRWPAVHALDAARLFRLALEGAAPGSVLHAVGDEGDHVLDIAGVIGRRLGLPVREVPAETFGFLGQVFVVDQPASSRLTQERFDWHPTHPSLLADLEEFLAPAA